MSLQQSLCFNGPTFDSQSEFTVIIAGAEHHVTYRPRPFSAIEVSHFEFRGPKVSETGYRSKFAYPQEWEGYPSPVEFAQAFGEHEAAQRTKRRRAA